ncbi:MAG: DNA repair protein [Lachnospiraceae bacterium]|nr:DNA repair protein [Lachnospiraceae bacterium]
MEKNYLCIDLKSFYASVECVERGLNPMTTNLVVADPARNKGTICLAVSPSLKALGVRNRCRVFEIPDNVEYIMAPPRMKLYIDYSAKIYSIYLKYISKDDIQVYSIDEAFLDVTDYLRLYHMSATELAFMIMNDIRQSIGVIATCGIGTNLYLAKVALDITAKHSKDNIGYLNEDLYRKTLWNHRPITDFWRIGSGTAARLSHLGIFTMGEVALADEKQLYKTFGIDAEYLIDHAWGRESATIASIKAYKPKCNSLSSGQVLMRDYNYEEGLLIVKEMVDLLCLDLVEKSLVTDSISLHIGYSKGKNGCTITKSTGGSEHLPITTNSVRVLTKYFTQLYQKTTNKAASIRRVVITFPHVLDETYEQYDLFTDPMELEKDRRLQKAVLNLKHKYGKNSIIKGMNLQSAATTLERNQQIGGHKSGES